MKNIVIFLLFTFFTFTSCVRDKEINQPIVDYGSYSPAIALADYCYFKKNSYWIYQDSLNGKIDCTYVTSAQLTTYTVNANSGKDYIGTFHYYNMFTKDGIGDVRQYEVYDEIAAQGEKCCGGRYYCEVHWNRPPGPLDSMGNSTTGIYFGSYTFMFNDFNDGTTGGSGVSSGHGDECWARGIINNLNVLTNIYNDVKIFEFYKTAGLLYPYPTRIKNYIVKNIGVVKRIDLDSNRTWNLIRYNIVQ